MNEIRFLENRANPTVKICGRVDSKNAADVEEQITACLQGVTDPAVVLDVNRHVRSSGVGASDRFEAFVHEKELVRSLFIFVYFVAFQPLCFFEYFNNVRHPSFTLTFKFGPPSETRTHSL